MKNTNKQICFATKYKQRTINRNFSLLCYSQLNYLNNIKLLAAAKPQQSSLSQIQFDASIGLILGDASLNTLNEGKTYRLKFEWSDKHKPYIDYVFNMFNEWVISPPHKKERISPCFASLKAS